MEFGCVHQQTKGNFSYSLELLLEYIKENRRKKIKNWMLFIYMRRINLKCHSPYKRIESNQEKTHFDLKVPKCNFISCVGVYDTVCPYAGFYLQNHQTHEKNRTENKGTRALHIRSQSVWQFWFYCYDNIKLYTVVVFHLLWIIYRNRL